MSKGVIVARVVLAAGILLLGYGMYMDRTTPGLGGLGYAVLAVFAFLGLILPASIVLLAYYMKNRKKE